MNDELVERVARAILHRRTQNDLNITINGTYVLDWDKEVARAAIAECERSMEGTKDALKSALLSIADLNEIRAKLEAQAAAMRAMLEKYALIEDYDFPNSPPKLTGHSCPMCSSKARPRHEIEHTWPCALSPEAGQKVLDVVRAATETCGQNHMNCPGANRVKDALSALGWKP